MNVLDPALAFRTIQDNFLRYIKTAFGTDSAGFETERERLLRRVGTFSQEPWIEARPRYESSGLSISELDTNALPGFSEEELDDFQALASCGLIEDYELHAHQVEMLRHSISGWPAVVTAGTGSGKTESFLLPLFAYLAKESRGWSKPGEKLAHQDDWWRDQSWQQQCAPQKAPSAKKSAPMTRPFRVPQRAHETRPAAVRALVLYPMNALVEDQLTRLRRALDSDSARNWLNQFRSGNRIYLGRYNSSTPIPGHEYNRPDRHGAQTPDRDRNKQLREQMSISSATRRMAERHAIDTEDTSVLDYFPRLDGAEMRSRWDMQDAPPDILITNYSMLSIMLMRDADSSIFERTREWLEREGSVFHLIIDELHLYRGTAGTEVAYLLRLLLHRLGLTPDSPKLRILAASASLEPEDADSLTFLEGFFGREWHSSDIIPGRPAAPRPAAGLPLDRSSFEALAAARGDEETRQAASALVTTLGGNPVNPQLSVNEELGKCLKEAGIAEAMATACAIDGEPRAVSMSNFARKLFGNEDGRAAAEGLIRARAIADDASYCATLILHMVATFAVRLVRA